MKKQNNRTSIITRKKYKINSLIRFTYNDKVLELSPKNIQGRGYYIEKDAKVLEDPKTTIILSKRFSDAKNLDDFIKCIKKIT